MVQIDNVGLMNLYKVFRKLRQNIPQTPIKYNHRIRRYDIYFFVVTRKADNIFVLHFSVNALCMIFKNLLISALEALATPQ